MIKRIKQGETEALDVLIEGHYDGIYRFCYYRLGDREAAYDCAQETLQNLDMMLQFLKLCIKQVVFYHMGYQNSVCQRQVWLTVKLKMLNRLV